MPRRLERDRFSSDPLPRSSWSSSESCRKLVWLRFDPHNPSFVGYINEFEIVDDNRSGKIVVELNGRLNKCGVISPRYDLKLKDFEKFVYHILPSRQFGKVILTTTYGIMDHEEAKRKHIGGKVLGYFYWLRRLYCKHESCWPTSQTNQDWVTLRVVFIFTKWVSLSCMLPLIKLY